MNSYKTNHSFTNVAVKFLSLFKIYSSNILDQELFNHFYKDLKFVEGKWIKFHFIKISLNEKTNWEQDSYATDSLNFDN